MEFVEGQKALLNNIKVLDCEGHDWVMEDNITPDKVLVVKNYNDSPFRTFLVGMKLVQFGNTDNIYHPPSKFALIIEE